MTPDILRTGYMGNIYVRSTYLAKKGEITNGHAHKFDHMTVIIRGQVRVEATTPDGRKLDRIFGEDSPWGIRALILKGVEHKITATKDDTVFWCVYSIRDKDGQVTEEVTGWEPAFG